MTSSLIRAALGRLAPPGPKSRLSVLIFHRVLRERDPLQPDIPTAAEFQACLRWVKRHFNVMPLADAVRGIRGGTLPARPLAITFDDGYADNHDVALPVLRDLDLPATFFIATGYLDGGLMFNDEVVESFRQATGSSLDLRPLGMDEYLIDTPHARIAAIADILPRVKRMALGPRADLVARMASIAQAAPPRDLMMSRGQVAALSQAGMGVGGHTSLHPILAELDRDAAWREIRDGREALQEIVGKPVTLFAYPNGRPREDYLVEHAAMVRDLGFDGAVSTARGVARPGDDPYQIPRFTPWDHQPVRFGLRLGLNLRHVEYIRA